ncbi:hypothetical protein C8A00DRAFT_36717 [Chaetomidium leptoderma]|uniref:Uncharacterized protein n=1 Tax=Chaetomidium leptoderma TaxID=669021 RepID=A0AAN6ZUL8_9PEZI|nr:hypothetical protein C8A00DRAFT_36717 [Chaetomidium leptoderma]
MDLDSSPENPQGNSCLRHPDAMDLDSGPKSFPASEHETKATDSPRQPPSQEVTATAAATDPQESQEPPATPTHPAPQNNNNNDLNNTQADELHFGQYLRPQTPPPLRSRRYRRLPQEFYDHARMSLHTAEDYQNYACRRRIPFCATVSFMNGPVPVPVPGSLIWGPRLGERVAAGNSEVESRAVTVAMPMRVVGGQQLGY